MYRRACWQESPRSPRSPWRPQGPRRGPPQRRQPSTPASRRSPTARSAPPTSSSPTATNDYIGQAAHCSGTGGNTETNGCTAARCPIGTPVEVTGASQPGTMVYNSWLTMQAHGRDRRRHLPVQRPRAGQARPGRRRQGQPVGPVLGRPDRRRRRAAARRRRLHATATRSCAAASRSSARSSGKVVEVDGGGWSYNVYTADAGHPR